MRNSSWFDGIMVDIYDIITRVLPEWYLTLERWSCGEEISTLAQHWSHHEA